jgi:sigma-B regulation protein RsbU (phosphoserine phosphatase)
MSENYTHHSNHLVGRQNIFPNHERLSVYGTMIPAAQVGGDLFDCFMLDDHRLAFTIGDVSGKGIAAALFMAVSRTVLRVAATKGLSPQDCLLEAHQFLYGERRATSHFVTCFYGILDLATGQLEYSRAGHNPPYLVRGNEVQTLDAASGLPLGMLRRVSYDTATVQLEPGDTLLLFTDGITEAMNPRQEEYGEERLVEMLSGRAASLSVEELVRLVTQEAIAFAEGAPASDDMTVLGVRYR